MIVKLPTCINNVHMFHIMHIGFSFDATIFACQIIHILFIFQITDLNSIAVRSVSQMQALK